MCSRPIGCILTQLALFVHSLLIVRQVGYQRMDAMPFRNSFSYALEVSRAGRRCSANPVQHLLAGGEGALLPLRLRLSRPPASRHLAGEGKGPWHPSGGTLRADPRPLTSTIGMADACRQKLQHARGCADPR